MIIRHCPFCSSLLSQNSALKRTYYNCPNPSRHRFRFSVNYNCSIPNIYNYLITFPPIISSNLQYSISFSSNNLTQLYFSYYDKHSNLLLPSKLPFILSINLFLPPNDPFPLLDRLLKLSPLA